MNDDDKLGIAKLFESVQNGSFKPKRYMTRYYSFIIPALEPGQDFHQEFRVSQAFRPNRIVVKMKAEKPLIRFYMNRVGGSKRRGRLASNRFHIDLLRHPHMTPQLIVRDIRVGVNSQLTGPVPAMFFSSEWPVDVSMDTATPDKCIAFSFVNGEFARVISGAFACFGLSYD